MSCIGNIYVWVRVCLPSMLVYSILLKPSSISPSIIFYLSSCFCCKMICKQIGYENSIELLGFLLLTGLVNFALLNFFGLVKQRICFGTKKTKTIHNNSKKRENNNHNTICCGEREVGSCCCFKTNKKKNKSLKTVNLSRSQIELISADMWWLPKTIKLSFLENHIYYA